MILLLFVFIGIAFGLLGLIPFIHTNLLLEVSKNFFSSGLAFSVFAASLAFSHLVFESIPSIFLSIPSASQSVSVLPAHELVLRGKGVAALKITLNSFFYSLSLSLMLLPFNLFLMPIVFYLLKDFLAFLLLLILATLFASEESLKTAFIGLIILIASGLFGFLSFSFAPNSLFPLLTGLFGTSSLLLAINARTQYPHQKNYAVSVDKKTVFLGCLIGSFSSLFPALNPAVLSSLAFILLERTPIAFLTLNASVVSSKMFFDFASIFTINKARTGAAVVVKQSLDPTFSNMALLIAAMIASAFIAIALLSLALNYFIKHFHSTNFFKANLFFIALLLALVYLSTGFLGFFIAIIATAIGLLPPLMKVKRSYCMGSLIIPSLLYSFGLNYELASLVLG